MRRGLTLAIGAAALLGGGHLAQAQVYKNVLTGSAEVPPVATQGSGSFVITINPATHELRVTSTFANLSTGTTASHVHCCVPQPGPNAGVATTTPSFAGFPLGVTSGAMDRTYDMRLATTWNPAFVAANGGSLTATEAAFIAGAAANQSYLNIHTTAFPGGEIRGTLVRMTFAGNPALTPGARGAATGLDTVGAGTGAMSNAIIALAVLTPGQQAAALERLAPSPATGRWLAGAAHLRAAFDQIDGRAEGADVAQGEAAAAVWMKAYGLNERQSGRSGFAGFHTDGWGLEAGAERRISDGATVGIALAYGDGEVSYRGPLRGDEAKVRSTQLTVYAVRDFAGGGYLDAMVAHAWQKTRSRRDTGLSGLATASADGDAWGGRIGAGAPIALRSSLSITPQARLDWLRIKGDAYTEVGAGGLGLSVAGRSVERVRSSLGARLDFAGAQGEATFRPFLRGFWNYDFKNDGVSVDAAFLGGGNVFSTPGLRTARSTFTGGVGVNVATRSAMSATLSYDGTFGKSYRGHLVQAKVRWAF